VNRVYRLAVRLNDRLRHLSIREARTPRKLASIVSENRSIVDRFWPWFLWLGATAVVIVGVFLWRQN
jgi:hypothetical protein